MPWFCGSRNKKHHNKLKVGRISQQSIDDSILTNGRPSFTVALQDFDATVTDELSARRGQVLEALYNDREWVYVRNIDGKCGYVPQTFCYPLDAANDNAFLKNTHNSSQHRVRPKSLHLVIGPVDEGSQSSVGLNQCHEQVDAPQPLTSTPLLQRATSVTPDSTVSLSTLSENPQAHRPVPHRKLSTGNELHHKTRKLNDTIGEPTYSTVIKPETCDVQAISESTPGQATVPALPQTPGAVSTTLSKCSKPLRHNRSCSASTDRDIVNHDSGHTSFQYLPYSTRSQAVRRSVSAHEGNQLSGTNRVHPRLSAVSRPRSYQEAVVSSSEQLHHTTDETLTVDQLSSNDSPGCSRKNCDCSTRSTSNTRRSRFHRQRAVDYDSADDVFVSNTGDKKPFGIFRCLQDYHPKFEGEILLRKNELVIVLDYGQGEWAWVVTSNHVEGLIPKKLLVRYNSDRGTCGVIASKGTDASTQTELIVSGAVRQVSGASSASGGPGASSGNISPLDDTLTLSSRGTAKTVVASAAVQTDTSSDWFIFSDSLERPSHLSSTAVKSTQLPKSAPVTPLSVTSKQTRPVNIPSHTDRVMSLSSKALSDLSPHGMPALTAAKDYIPPQTTANCLTLKKGDVLTPQSHMRYPKGWMWVWHAEQKRFGYVPNSTVMYTYPISRNSRRTSTIEDAV